MTDVRKYAIILTLAVLTAIFIFSLAEAVVPEPEYPSICVEAQDTDRSPQQPIPRTPGEERCEETPEPTQEEIDACPGQLHLNYNTCEYQCHCYELTREHQQQKESIIFWIAILLAGAAIVTGMLLPARNPLNEWVGSGFILGGVITLFIATIRYWSELHKIARPVIIALEIAIVLWIAYKRFMPNKKTSNKK